MTGRGTVAADGFDVRGGSVTFVLCKAVLRELCIKFNHQPVAGDFGNNAGGSNRKALSISFDNASGFTRQAAHGISVNQRQIGLWTDLRNRFGHSFPGGLQNVDLVNDVRPDDGTADADKAAVPELFIKNSRRLALSTLESVRPEKASAPPFSSGSRSKATAAATTGPASGPRPASSTPVIKKRPDCQASFS